MRAAIVSALVLAASASAVKHGHQLHIGHLANHVTNIAGAVEAVGNAHAALSSRSDDNLYARDVDEDLYARALEARNKHGLHIGHIANHVTNVAGAVEAVGNAHAALHSRDEDSLYAREYDDALYGREYDDVLYGREFDEDLYGRDFEEDLYARELEDALYARALEARNRHQKIHIGHLAEHVTNIAGAVEAVGNAHAALHSRADDDLWARYYDELD